MRLTRTAACVILWSLTLVFTVCAAPRGHAAPARTVSPERTREADAHFEHALSLLERRSIEARRTAIAELERATTLDPAHADAQLLLARTYLVAGFRRQAMRRFERVVALSPDEPEARFGLAQVWRRDWLKYLEPRSLERAIDHAAATTRLDPLAVVAWLMLCAVRGGGTGAGAWAAETVSATADGEGWTLSGTARHVVDADRADRIAVVASTDGSSDGPDGGLGVFVVPADAVTVTRENSFDPALHVATVVFDGARANAEGALSGAADVQAAVIRAGEWAGHRGVGPDGGRLPAGLRDRARPHQAAPPVRGADRLVPGGEAHGRRRVRGDRAGPGPRPIRRPRHRRGRRAPQPRAALRARWIVVGAAVAVLALCKLPLYLIYGDDFVRNSYGALVGFGQVLTHFSLTGILQGFGAGGAAKLGQILVALAAFAIALRHRALAPDRFDVVFVGLCYVWEVLFASYATRYLYFPGFFLIALGLAMAAAGTRSAPRA